MSEWWNAAPVVGDESAASAAAPPLAPAHRDLAIRTIYGEAANEPDQGQAAVAAVIKNRMQAGRYGGDTLPGVVLAKNQFEPWWNPEARQRLMALKPEDPRYQKIGGIVDQMFGGQMEDPTGGATHFVAPQAQAALGRQMPSWAQGEGLPIGRHTFFAPEGRVQTAVAKGGDWWSSAPSVAGESQGAGGGQFAAPMPDGGNFRTAREGVSPTVATSGEAISKGMLRGATFNWMDELNALARAGGLTPEELDINKAQADPAKAVSALVRGAYRLASGDPDALAAYHTEASAQRAEAARMREQQPGASLGGELGGALATIPFTGGGSLAPGAGFGARTLQGAKIGAVQGAIGGAGEGTDLASRAAGAGTGGAIGGILGAAAPGAVDLAGKGLGVLAKPFQSIINTARGAIDPETEAARRVAVAVQRDFKTAGGPPGLTAPEYAASITAGGPAAVVDLGGETTRALARSAANTSPEARAALTATTSDRFESQSDRVTGWLNKTFGPSDTGATREALQDAARQANKPAYAKAYREGDQPLWSTELQRLVGSPDVVDAMKAAAEKGKSRAIVDGFGGFNSSVQVNPSGVVQFTRGVNGQPTYPNLQFWDYTRRSLSDAAKQAERAGRTEEAGTLKQLAGKLNSELDNLVPSYQQARAGAARFFGAQDASEAGQKFLSSNDPIADSRRAFAQMTPPERQLFKEGFVQSLTQKIEATGDRRNVLNSIAQSPRAREQMELAMGPQGAREFEAMMRVEGVMDLARGAVQGNSTTARQLTELGLAGGAYGVGTLGDITNPNPGALATAALMYGAAKGRNAINQNVARQVGEMLASNDTSVLRKGINIVARNQTWLNALRSFDRGIASVGGQQGKGLVPIQAGATGRADEN